MGPQPGSDNDLLDTPGTTSFLTMINDLLSARFHIRRVAGKPVGGEVGQSGETAFDAK